MHDSSAAVDLLLHRRVVAAMGKGGAGRTTFCFGLARIAARRGLHTLIMETDPRAPIAAAFGVSASFTPLELEKNLHAMLLDRQQSLEEYLGFVVARPLLRAVFGSSFYQLFVHAAPALRELMVMGKIFHEIERRPVSSGRWDLVVVDLPATAQAIGMLSMPFAAQQTFGRNLVGREARVVGEFFRDPDKCAIVIVTSAQQLAITETLEIHRKLAALRIGTSGIIFNRLTRATFEAADVEQIRRADFRGLSRRDLLAQIAQAELDRRAIQHRALRTVQRRVHAPIIPVGEYHGIDGLRLADRIAAAMVVSG